MLPPAGLLVQYHALKGPPGTVQSLEAEAAVIVVASSLVSADGTATGTRLRLLGSDRVLEDVEFSATPAAGKWSFVPNFRPAQDWDGAAYNSAAAQRKAAKEAARAAIPEPTNRKPRQIRNQ